MSQQISPKALLEAYENARRLVYHDGAARQWMELDDQEKRLWIEMKEGVNVRLSLETDLSGYTMINPIENAIPRIEYPEMMSPIPGTPDSAILGEEKLATNQRYSNAKELTDAGLPLVLVELALTLGHLHTVINEFRDEN